ncbi:MAG: ribosome recycling factor [Nitrospinota bacterium]
MPGKIEEECRHKMDVTLSVLTREMQGIRTGRASAALLDSIKVDYYGNLTPISQVASVSVPENRMIAIQPWDVSQLGEIEKAILASDLGITPQNDGKIIRLVMPPLTEERRKEMVKIVKNIGEDNKVAIRNVRREKMDILKRRLKKKELSQDDEKKLEQVIQKMTDEFIVKVDTVVQNKEKEILEN